jgi:hypothetical protein
MGARFFHYIYKSYVGTASRVRERLSQEFLRRSFRSIRHALGESFRQQTVIARKRSSNPRVDFVEPAASGSASLIDLSPQADAMCFAIEAIPLINPPDWRSQMRGVVNTSKNKAN